MSQVQPLGAAPPRAASARLATVTIENLPYAEFIERYDRPATLFYLDPTYWGCENHYGKGLFERADFARFAELLRRLKGRFILSLNDVPQVRATFTGFRIETVEMVYKFRGTKRVTELVITGGGAAR
ncbi:MAG: DNA adenine methylase [Kiloniellaceae bacterium]